MIDIGHKIFVYVLDDDQYILDILERLFKKNKVEHYRLFNDPNTLLDNLHRDVHILICDQNLGGGVMTGLEVIKKVKETNPYCYFIMISGYNSFKAVLEFDHIALRGHFVYKGDQDCNEQVINYLKEFTDDIGMMFETYNMMEETKKHVEDLKEILIRKGSDDAK